MFQSTPPAEARGDRRCHRCRNRSRGEVSIHSPRRSEGRRRFLRLASSLRCFNPLPPPKRGETSAVGAVGATAKRVSIHSPRRSEGRLLLAVHSGTTKRGVSIHSPRRSEGRRRSHGSPGKGDTGFNPLPPPKRGETCDVDSEFVHLGQFQSTPPAEARGDAVVPRRAADTLVSIHSPRRSEGRHGRWREGCAGARGFNPLPPPKRGEICRPEPSALGMCCFNPLPPPKRGETRPSVCSRGYHACFNPLPPPKRGPSVPTSLRHFAP